MTIEKINEMAARFVLLDELHQVLKNKTQFIENSYTEEISKKYIEVYKDFDKLIRFTNFLEKYIVVSLDFFEIECITITDLYLDEGYLNIYFDLKINNNGATIILSDAIEF